MEDNKFLNATYDNPICDATSDCGITKLRDLTTLLVAGLFIDDDIKYYKRLFLTHQYHFH